MTLNISCQSFLACKVSLRNYLTVLWELSCSLLSAFLLPLLRFFSILNLWHFNYDVSWSGPLCIHLVWDSLCYLDLHVSFLHKLGKFSFIIFSDSFPVSCSFFSFSGTPMMQMLERLKLSSRLLTLSLFYWILFLLVLHGCFLLPYVPHH